MDVNCNYNSFSDKWIAIGYRRTSEKEDAIRDIFLYYGDKPAEDMEEIYIKKNTYSVEDDYEDYKCALDGVVAKSSSMDDTNVSYKQNGHSVRCVMVE